MAEIFGVVAGALSVAALFNNVVDCFEYIQLGRNFGTDYQTCQVKLDIARLRLSRWGDAVKINNDRRFTEVIPSDGQVRIAKNTLKHLLYLFHGAYTESSIFQLAATEEELALFDPSTNTDQAVVALRNTMHALAHKRQETTSLSKKISWTLYQYKSFMRLIEDIQELLDSLEAIFPRQEAYRRMVEIEIEEVGTGPSLQVLSEAAQDTDDLLQAAASRRLEAFGGLSDFGFVYGAVKVGNKYTPQVVPRRTGVTTSQFGGLDVHFGASYGTKGFWDSTPTFKPKAQMKIQAPESAEAEGSGSVPAWTGASLPQGYQDLTDQIQKKGCELLNLDGTLGSVDVLFQKSRPSDLGESSSNTEVDWVESDVDAQLMLFIPFHSAVKLHTLQLTSLPPDGDYSPVKPRTIHLYINQLQNLGFDDAGGTLATQVITLEKQDWNSEGTANVALRFVKFQNVSSLVIFIQDGDDDGERTRLDRVRLIGSMDKSKIRQHQMGDKESHGAAVGVDQKVEPSDYPQPLRGVLPLFINDKLNEATQKIAELEDLRSPPGTLESQNVKRITQLEAEIKKFEPIPDSEITETATKRDRHGVLTEGLKLTPETYYNGLHGGLKLVASTIPGALARTLPRDPTDAGFFVRNRLFTIERGHQIVITWESQILPGIRGLNQRGKMLSVNCVRVGVEKVPEDNPVVVLILVERDSFQETTGHQLALDIKAICERWQATDVHVEIAEKLLPRNAQRTGGHGEPHVLDGPFDRNLYIGSSVGPSGDRSSGTIAAHFTARQKEPPQDELLLALTCDHVCFTSSRPCHEQNLVNWAYKFSGSSNVRYEMLTPSEPDTVATEQHLNNERQAEEAERMRLEAAGEQELLADQEQRRNTAGRNYKEFLAAKRRLGNVFGTGGACRDTLTQMPMDWGVILEDLKLDPKDLNKLPPINFVGGAQRITAIRDALGQPNFRPVLGPPGQGAVPPGTLPAQISRLRSEAPEPNEVFFKVGRTTGWTAGRYNPCKSMVFNMPPAKHPGQFANVAGQQVWQHEYADYGWCLYWCFLGIPPELPFGAPGDSGSLVFDREGQATGLYFSGFDVAYSTPQDISCAISLAAVIRDMERQLDVTNIRLASDVNRP